MRQKSILLFLILTQFFFTNVFGQASKRHLVIYPSSDRADSESTSTRKSIFYSNAAMYVAKNMVDDGTGSGNKKEDAALYVEGTMKYDNAAQIHQEGETTLTGDFVSIKDAANKNDLGDVKLLFLDAGTAKDGVVRFYTPKGDYTRQHIVRETLNGVPYENPNYTSRSTSGSAPTPVVDPSDYKVGENGMYVINFPKLIVDKQHDDVSFDEMKRKKDLLGNDLEINELLIVNSNVAMSVGELDLTKGNRFSAQVVSYGIELDILSPISSPDQLDYYRTNSAYVNIHKVKNMPAAGYNAEDVKPELVGFHEVDMMLYDPYFIEDTNMFGPITLKNKGGAETTTKASFMRGFTSPFDKLRADYMFYHVLTKPNASSIAPGGPIASPETEIVPGEGYFMAMDVSPEHYEGIESTWDHGKGSSKYRAQGGYNLSRIVQRMKDYDAVDPNRDGKKFSLYTFDKNDLTADEGRELENQLFNVDNVEVDVRPGFAYLGNPFMSPINISGLLAKDKTSTSIKPEDALFTEPYQAFSEVNNVMAVHGLTQTGLNTANGANSLLLRSQYWVPHSALAAYINYNGAPAYAYNVQFDNVVAVPQAATVTRPFDWIIEPMQMFVVQAANSGKFTFHTKMKTFEGIAFPSRFLSHKPIENSELARSLHGRSGDDVSLEDSESFIQSDWILIEAQSVNTESRTVALDRTAVRFFDGASQMYQDLHDQRKFFNNTPATDGKQKMARNTVIGDVLEATAPTNVLYTQSAGSVGEKLLSYGVGYDTKEIPLNYLSSGTNGAKENVTLTFSGMEGFDKLQGVKLYDKYVHQSKKNAEEISEGYSYAFTPMPSREDVNGESRFTLIFGELDDEGPSMITTPITCYYSGSILHIGGLMEEDLGSKVQIFDLQGRLMASTTINNYPTMEYPKALGQGTFIVSITGKRNYKTKFVNLQNY